MSGQRPPGQHLNPSQSQRPTGVVPGVAPTCSHTASSSRGIPHLHLSHRWGSGCRPTLGPAHGVHSQDVSGQPGLSAQRAHQSAPQDPGTLLEPHSDPRGPPIAHRTLYVPIWTPGFPHSGASVHPTGPQASLGLDQPFPLETTDPPRSYGTGLSPAGRGFSRAARARPAPTYPPSAPSSIFCLLRATSAGFGKPGSGPGRSSEARAGCWLSGRGHRTAHRAKATATSRPPPPSPSPCPGEPCWHLSLSFLGWEPMRQPGVDLSAPCTL